jgi:predicted permease
VAGRLSWLSPSAEKGIAEFAFTLAMPALLFKSVATAEFSDISIAGIWLSYFGAIAVIWLAATLITWRILRRPANDAPPIAMSSTFGNSLMLGLPLAMATYGEQAAPVIAIILSIHAPTLWLTATLHASLTDQDGSSSVRGAIENLFADLSRNPIIIGIACGALWRLTGLALPPPVLTVLSLLAEASIPAALIALGLSVLGSEVRGQAPTLAAIISLKMLALPLLAYFLASQVFALTPVTQGVIAILAAVPTGANAFLFAAKTGRAVNSAAGAIALGTVLSAVTISLLLAALRL